MRPQFLWRPLWPASTGPTIWYGQGETGKGQMALAASVALCYGGSLAGLRGRLLDRVVVYLDYEDDFQEFSARVSRLVNGLDQAVPPNLRRFAREGSICRDLALGAGLKLLAATLRRHLSVQG